jgi:hypothetical protein
MAVLSLENASPFPPIFFPRPMQIVFLVMMYNRLMPAIEVTDLSKTFRTKRKAASEAEYWAIEARDCIFPAKNIL